MFKRAFTWALAACTVAGLATAATDTGWRDVLDTPAQTSALASRALLLGLARAGSTVVAVGQRGHALWSDDGGATWKQASVPVSSDLVAVSFPTAQVGWAVGHDGIVLSSADGGHSWTRRLDGRSLGELLVSYYRTAGDDKWLAEAQRFAAQGAENPFLDVWFKDAATGYIVGAFGLILRTTDGGAHWEPLMHVTDNPKALHLYAVRGVGSDVFVVGEQGTALKLDAASGRFKALELPYKGTLFGVTGRDGTVVVHGLRGTVLRSTDAGANWQTVPTGLAVGLTANTFDEQGRLVIVSQAGHVIASTDNGASFTAVKVDRPTPAAAVAAAGKGALVVAGPRGVQTVALP
jgi:photosystem II stability/assembly factor-like uncharacterized protein